MSSKLTVVVTSFLRPGALEKTVASLMMTGEPIDILIVDDSGLDYEPQTTFADPSVSVYRMPFDSGLSAKRNAAMKLIDTPYVLIVDDDSQIQRLCVDQLINELTPGIDFLCAIDGMKASLFTDTAVVFWRPQPYASLENRPLYHYVSNYLFGTRQAFLDNPWHEELHCGEHLPWAYEAYRKGVAITPTTALSVKNMATKGIPLYNAMRSRADHFRKDWVMRNLNQPDISHRR